MARKKILIFSLAYFPRHVGGAEVAIKEIVERIPTDEYDFHMVCLRFDSTLQPVERVGNILVHRIGFTKPNASMADLRRFPLHLNKFLFQFLAGWKAIRLHQVHHYDGIWAMMAHSCGVPAAIFNLAYPKVPLLLTLQEGDPIDYIKRKMRPVYPLFARAFRKATIIQAISTFLGAWARSMEFKGPLEVIPNAVNTKHFSQSYAQEELDTLKKVVGKKEGDIYLITTSRLVTKNACDDVIKALVHLPKQYHFLILGIGPDEEMLRGLAKASVVEDRTHFIGQVSHSEMPKYLKISDIFIRPSLSEGMGNSFVEAMAAELPVIATQEGGIADFLFDPVKNPGVPSTGRAVDPRDPKGIAHVTEEIVAHPKETREMVENAKKLAFEKYDWDLIAKDMKERAFDRLFT
jgi:glycosyltransferase involved in cell wall biosynthesis